MSYMHSYKMLKAFLKGCDEPLPEMKKTFNLEHTLLMQYIIEYKENVVLDIGCGVGRTMIGLAQSYPYILCVGIDHDTKVLNIAKERTKDLSHIFFEKADALNLTYGDDVFDLSFSSYNTLGSFPASEREKFVAEQARVTRMNGYVITFGWTDDERTTQFLKKYYPYIGLDILEIDNKKTITDEATFYRLGWEEVYSLYEKHGIDNVAAEDAGLWTAVIGIKR